MILLARKRIVLLAKLYPTCHSYSNVPVPTADFLTNQHHISPVTALKVSSTISHIKYPHRSDYVLPCLKETGFSLPQIDLMINTNPRILIANPKVLMKKLKMFEDKGFSTSDIVLIVSKNPHVLHMSLNNRLIPLIDALKATLGSTKAVRRVLKKLDWFLRSDLRKTMIPNIEFLKKRSGLSSSQVMKYVIRNTWLFLYQPDTIKDNVRRVDKMGLKWGSKMYLEAVRVVSSLSEENLELKRRFFRWLGLSENDVLRLFNRCPCVFGCSVNNIKETMEVLFRSGKTNPFFPLTDTVMLTYSLKKRIKPRLEMVKVLEDRGLLSEKLSLASILQMNNKEFLESTVLSNSNALVDDCVIRISKNFGLNPAV